MAQKMESPLDIMKTKIQLTVNPVPLTNADGIDVLVDYSKLKNNVPTPEEIASAANTPDQKIPETQATNDYWKEIGNVPEGSRLAQRIERLFKNLNQKEKDKINIACGKLTDRVDAILANPNKGLRDIFAAKSQYMRPNLTKVCSGPKDFFRFLFDFAVPPNINIRSILENPGAGGDSGQCWKVYPTGCSYSDPPRWDDGINRMHCYICDTQLTLSGGANKTTDMQCEHLFPFTEAQLFWVLFSRAINPIGDYETVLKDNIQVREYAPVCAHCNSTLKSALGILDLNNAWMNGDQNADIVTINELNIQKISGEFDNANLPHQNEGEGEGNTYQKRYNRLMNVFRPLVAAINTSLKARGITNSRQFSQFLIYKYLFYINDDVAAKLKVVFAGGENLVKLNQERKKRNNLFSRMLTKIRQCMNRRIGEASSSATAAAAATATAAAATKRAENTTRARLQAKVKAVAEAKEQAAAAAAAASLAAEKRKKKYMTKLQSFFSKIAGKTGAASAKVVPANIIEDMKKEIKDDTTGTDYIEKLGLDNAALLTELQELIPDETITMDGGGKLKWKQNGGNIDVNLDDATLGEKNTLLKAIIATTLAMYTLNDDVVDYGLIIYCLKELNNSLNANNIYSFNSIREEIRTIHTEAVASRIALSSSHPGINCDDPNSFTEIEYLKSIDERNNYIQRHSSLIQDNDSYKISRMVFETQREAQRQTTLTEYYNALTVNPDDPRINRAPPPVYELKKDRWPIMQEYHCLRCTKGKNTEGYSSRKGLFGGKSDYIYSIYGNGRQLEATAESGEPTLSAKFCYPCSRTPELKRRLLVAQNGSPKPLFDALQTYANQFTEKWERKQKILIKRELVAREQQERRQAMLRKKQEIRRWLMQFEPNTRVGLNTRLIGTRYSNGNFLMVGRENEVTIRPEGGPLPGTHLTITYKQIFDNWPTLLFWICMRQNPGSSVVPLPAIESRSSGLPPPGRSTSPCRRAETRRMNQGTATNPMSVSAEERRLARLRHLRANTRNWSKRFSDTGGGRKTSVKRRKKKTKKRKRKRKKKTRRKNKKKRRKKTKRRRKKKNKTRRRR